MSIARYWVAMTCALVLAASTACAETALVAAASNFAEAAAEIEAAFEAGGDHRVTISLGATGKVYAQIRAGAPYDVFLSADQRRPKMLETEGFAVKGTRYTFAIGQLTLWSADPRRLGGEPKSALTDDRVRAIAIANPALAPYGRAAQETLQKLGLWRRLTPRLVTGENIGQAFALTATGNAQLGFVATSLLAGKRGKALGGSRWDVPSDMHEPIRQDAVLLKRADTNKAARAFLDYLRDPKARAIMARLGYKVAND